MRGRPEISGRRAGRVPSWIGIWALLALCGGGCGNDTCNKDTDCRMPQICLAGACTLLGGMDASTDITVDLDAPPDEQEPDHVDAPDIKPDDISDPTEADAEEEDVEEIVEEDVEEIELPPATQIWSEDFSDAPVRWEFQNGDWSVEGGEYVQGSSNSFAESWVPGESWTDFAVEVSLMSVTRDTSAPLNVLGILVRAQQIDYNKYYRCAVDYKSNKLNIFKYDQDITPGYTELCAATDLVPALADNVWYKLQAIVTGDSIICRWLEGDVARVQVSTHDDSYTEGSIGLFAHYVSGRFDNVTVYDYRPAEWPAAVRRVPCP